MIIRDYVTGDQADILKGAALSKEGANTGTTEAFGIGLSNPATLDNFIGVSNEFYDSSEAGSGPDSSGSNSLTVVATGVSNYIKVIINPLAVYLAEYSQAAADDNTNTAASTGGKVVTATLTTDREGDWCYCTDTGSSAGAAGNLFQIGASNSTTDCTACTSYDDNMATSNTSDTYIWVTNPFSCLAAAGSLDLSAAAGNVNTHLKGVGATGAGAINVLQSYISDKNTPMEPLKVERNSGKTYDAPTAHLYSSVQFPEHLCLGAPRIVN